MKLALDNRAGKVAGNGDLSI
ncbi:MAG: hypothetical protein HWE25_15345 [Alphaproteobacteria bacterium]|nr:hypothetical protein [Alphaproteobacteria bacterium]